MMEQTLDQLGAFIAAHPERAFFERPADEDSILAVERAIGLKLPTSYLAFLLRFNGGFINVSGLEPEEEYWDLGTARWNSNWLFGISDLIKHYHKARSLGGWERIGYIPFCQTTNQEYLVFVPRADGLEPPVLDAFDESSEWAELYPDFPAMLRAYVETEGKIASVADG